MKILVAACISEGVLVILALAGQMGLSLPVIWNAQPHLLIAGALLALPPLVANHILWLYAERNPGSIYRRFSHQVIIPLCRQVNLLMALLVAILSGICEEWFFRGTLNALILRHLGLFLSCLLTSFLFASIHFIGSFKRYGGMLPLYTLMGAYLWGAHYLTQSLASVAMLHGIYNFVVIMMVKQQDRLSSTQTSSVPL